jgi:RHS repeat-associated protein
MALKPNITKSKRIFSKLTLIALVFLFVFQPIYYVFAQKRIDYAYDYKGQKIMERVITTSYDSNTGYTTTTVETTYYPTPTYTSKETTTEVRDKSGNLVSEETTEGATKHIFVNDLNIATIVGSGEDAKVYTNLADHLGGTNVVLDQDNEVVETTDYYSFGKMRLDNRTGDYSEQRKYIGQEFDQDTGLNYLNARYYNADMARFMSQDPVALTTPEQLLSDPQQLNFYSYARNNPIVYSDPNGKYAELVMKDLGLIPGAHGFINIVPEKGEDLSQYNINSGDGSHYTIGGYPSDWKFWSNKLEAQINNPGDYNLKDSDRLATYSLEVPEGMSVAQYDKSLLESGYALSQQDLGPYFGLGRPTWPNANSGNVWTQVVVGAGGEVPKIDLVYGNRGTGPYFPYGSGHPMGTQWFVSSAIQSTKQAVSYAGQVISSTASKIGQTTINSMSNTLSQISSIINSMRK